MTELTLLPYFGLVYQGVVTSLFFLTPASSLFANIIYLSFLIDFLGVEGGRGR